MRLGILFSGGKDSVYATWLAAKEGYSIECLISILSENEESFMFHTPSISKIGKHAEVMEVPFILMASRGEKEKELEDLEKAIVKAIKEYEIEGIVTGAVESVYQASRVQKICNKLGIECFNPIWQKDQIELLDDLIKEKFKVIISGVFAYPLNEKWLGREINKEFIKEVKELRKKYGISPSGEGGEFESFVLNCPLFKKELKIVNFSEKGEKNSWRMEVFVK
jgi:diphthine-ammonia ligase